MVAHGRSQDRNSSGNTRDISKPADRNKTYNYCKKKGHIKSEYYKLQNKNKRAGENQKQKLPEKSGEAIVVEDDSDGDLLVACDNDLKASSE